ncbi:MAG: DUF1194 domain-containing protein [Hyphomicrobiales bacterium]
MVRFAACAMFVLAILSIASLARAEPNVDLELVLLADATGSIDDKEIAFQREGYAEAITSSDVISAIKAGLHGKIAVTYVEWADANSQETVVDWTVIEDETSARSFAEALVKPPRRAFGYNAIGAALLYGKTKIETNSFEGIRRVIDFSADSANNWDGPPIFEARKQVLDAGIVINGLAVLCRHCSGQPSNYDLETAFRKDIIGGPGAFVVTVDNAPSFASAVRRKLILEIAGTPSAQFAKQ